MRGKGNPAARLGCRDFSWLGGDFAGVGRWRREQAPALWGVMGSAAVGSIGVKLAASRDNAKYSLRDVKIPTREDLEHKSPVKVVDISSPQTNGTDAERREAISRRIADVISKPYLNKDTNTLIFLTKKSYTHAFNNLGTIQLNAAEHLPELIENAVLTHGEDPTHGSDYTDGVYTFFAAVKTDRVMPVKLKVKEYRYEGQLLPKNIRDYFESNPGDYAASYDTVVLELEEIEESPPGSARDIDDVAPGPKELSAIKIADLLALVKGKAENMSLSRCRGMKKQEGKMR